ncbi:helix-turn-helix domain-containing protein [Nocardia sp. NPDC046473]|uniref:helix-turn-helix domain-containing protein n=1 Tax=Nocardia sp. NPDC046473 TaxID=3155733 RepID=UPI0033FD16A4
MLIDSDRFGIQVCVFDRRVGPGNVRSRSKSWIWRGSSAPTAPNRECPWKRCTRACLSALPWRCQPLSSTCARRVRIRIRWSIRTSNSCAESGWIRRGAHCLVTAEYGVQTAQRLDAAAGALHVHTNTVKYRLRRLWGLTGMSLEPPPGRVLSSTPCAGGGRCAAGSTTTGSDVVSSADGRWIRVA